MRELADLARAFEVQFGDGREPDYETIAYLADQIDACLALEYENPALLPLVEMLINRLADGDINQFRTFVARAREYILGTVWSDLSRDPARLDHLAPS